MVERQVEVASGCHVTTDWRIHDSEWGLGAAWFSEIQE